MGIAQMGTLEHLFGPYLTILKEKIRFQKIIVQNLEKYLVSGKIPCNLEIYFFVDLILCTDICGSNLFESTMTTRVPVGAN